MPGSIIHNMPARPDDLQRKQRDLERQAREQAAARSIDASSFRGGAQLGPVAPAQASNSARGFAIPAMPTTIQQARASVTVPDGYTRAVVIATAQGGGQCPGPADYLYVHAVINDVVHQTTALPSLTSGTANAGGYDTFTTILSGLASGESVTAGALLGTNSNAWAASPLNGAQIDLTAIFF